MPRADTEITTIPDAGLLAYCQAFEADLADYATHRDDDEAVAYPDNDGESFLVIGLGPNPWRARHERIAEIIARLPALTRAGRLAKARAYDAYRKVVPIDAEEDLGSKILYSLTSDILREG